MRVGGYFIYMIPVHEYIAQLFIGHTFRFKCDCLMALDITGRVVDWEEHSTEIVLLVDVDKKIVKIGLNHPTLTIEKVL